MEGKDLYSLMQSDEPLARYKKTILGKVHVTILDEFSQEPTEVILEGNPEKRSDLETAMVEVWTDRGDAFFKRINKKHFDAGRLIKVEGKLPKATPSPNVVTDKELDEILNMKFLALKAQLDKFTSEAPVFRLLNRARELEKSEKLIKHIEERLSEIQLASYTNEEEEEE